VGDTASGQLTLQPGSRRASVAARGTRPPSGRGCGRPPLRDLAGALVSVVGAADERTGGHRLESEPVGRSLQGGELVRAPVADDGEVLLGGAQLLARGQHLAAVLAAG